MKTVKVKIAVAVDETGGWCAFGRGGWTEDETKSDAVEFLRSRGWSCVLHWIEADVPIPEPETIQGIALTTGKGKEI